MKSVRVSIGRCVCKLAREFVCERGSRHFFIYTRNLYLSLSLSLALYYCFGVRFLSRARCERHTLVSLRVCARFRFPVLYEFALCKRALSFVVLSLATYFFSASTRDKCSPLMREFDVVCLSVDAPSCNILFVYRFCTDVSS